jgi:hypothetical protein
MVSLIIKTLQSTPTNREALKGLLTYRTIQFSMSSGCCHPKILPPRPASGTARRPQRPFPTPGISTADRSRRQKIRGPISSLSLRPLRPLLSSAFNLPNLCHLSKLSFDYFPACGSTNRQQFTPLPTFVKGFFSTTASFNSQRSWVRKYLKPESAQAFFSFFFRFFSGPRFGKHWRPETAAHTPGPGPASPLESRDSTRLKGREPCGWAAGHS